MGEWLTTGEMIDRLKVGEIAESETGEKVKIFPVYNTLEFGTVKNTLLWIDENGQPLGFYLTENNRAVKWRILPKYVNFEEAMKALMNGKTVWLWKNGKKRTGYCFDKENGKLWFTVSEIAGKVGEIQFGIQWTIED